jgi:hypothetical protein
VKTCDDIYSKYILVRPVDLVHSMFPIFLAHCPLLRIVLTIVSAYDGGEAFYDPVLALSRFKAGAYDLAILDIKCQK